MLDVRAVMGWPRDLEGRQAFLRVAYLQALADMEDLSPWTGPPDPALRRLIEGRRELLGGWSALMETPPAREVLDEAARRAIRAEGAGATLWLTYLLQARYADRVGPISLRKVRALLTRKGSPFFPEPPGLRALNEAWDQFQPVAHLWAARFVLRTWPVPDVLLDLERDLAALHRLKGALPSQWQADTLFLVHHGPHLLALAKALQDFGLGYVPRHAHKPILDPEGFWTLADLPAWPVHLPEVTLPEELIERFDDY
jgi:hypothetical protein